MRVKRGEIYIAADGGKYGHLVVDVERFKDCDDVVTHPFDASGLSDGGEGNRIDKFKLTMVRYYRCDEVPLPEWIPSDVIIARSNM